MILRAVYLKGATIADLWRDYLAMAILSVVFVSGAIATYEKQN